MLTTTRHPPEQRRPSVSIRPHAVLGGDGRLIRTVGQPVPLYKNPVFVKGWTELIE